MTEAPANQFIDIEIDEMSYPDMATPLIQNLRVRVERGEAVSLVGRSGCGKTTVLRISAGLETRFTGKVQINGQRISGPIRGVQMLFQDGRLLPWKSATANVAFASPAPFSRNARTAARKLLEEVGVGHRLDARPAKLSGGELSRVALARAFFASPEVLLLDEPLRGLDVSARSNLIELIRASVETRSMTALMVTHDIDDAVLFSDRIITLGGKPLSVTSEIVIRAPHPRNRTSEEVQRTASEVVQQLLRNP